MVLTALRSSGDGEVLGWASHELRGDKDLCREAVALDGLALRFCSTALRADTALVFLALRENGLALEWASGALQGSRNAVIASIGASQGAALRFASPELRGAREVMLRAVALDGDLLEHCTSHELLNDRRLVLAAVRSRGRSLRWASHSCKGDLEVGISAPLRLPGAAVSVTLHACRPLGGAGGRAAERSRAGVRPPAPPRRPLSLHRGFGADAAGTTAAAGCRR